MVLMATAVVGGGEWEVYGGWREAKMGGEDLEENTCIKMVIKDPVRETVFD